MTHVFDMSLHRVIVPFDMPEWQDRHPISKTREEALDAIRIQNGWMDGASALNAEDMPKVLIAQKPRKTWPDAMQVGGGLTVVSDRARAIIEAFDPDVHQFFELRLETKRGVEIQGPWFAMNVTVHQESIVMDRRSSISYSEQNPKKLNYVRYERKLVMVDPSKQSGVHLWREERFIGSFLCSDSLMAAFKEAGIKFFPSFKAQDLGCVDVHLSQSTVLASEMNAVKLVSVLQ